MILQLQSDSLDIESIHSISTLMSNSIERETDYEVVNEQAIASIGDKGDPITIGTIVLAAISTGTVISLLDVIKTYLSKEPELTVTIDVREQKVHLNSKNISTKEILTTLEKLDGLSQ